MRTIKSSDEFFDLLDTIKGGCFVTIGYVTSANVELPIIKRKNPQDRSQEKYYPAPVYTDEIGVDELAEEISYATSMTPTDVKAVLEGLLNVMPKHLRRGVKIKLNRFGTFKVIFGGNGQENAEDVTASDIDGTRISFIGASEMKKAVLTDMPFQKVV